VRKQKKYLIVEPDGERRKSIDIEVCRTKVKVTTSKNRTNI
jgi:hypothetical protein